jgi:NADPH2:quinone reductase
MTTLGFSRFGGTDVLELRDLAPTPPGAGQVLLRVAAAPIHPVDLVARDGSLTAMLPPRDFYTPGWDAAGTIEALGDGVTGFAVGDQVIAFNPWFDTMASTQGTWTTLDVQNVARKPLGASAVAASTLPLNALTALQALDRLGLPAGATLVVVGAAGSVGGFALELARERGLRVYGVASAGDEAFVTGTGATFVERPQDPELLGKAIRSALADGIDGVDGVLDAPSAGTSVLEAVADGGRYVALLPMSLPEPERGIEVMYHGVRPDRGQLEHLVDLVERGALTLRVAATFPLAQAASAHTAQAGGVRGVVVLTI